MRKLATALTLALIGCGSEAQPTETDVAVDDSGTDSADTSSEDVASDTDSDGPVLVDVGEDDVPDPEDAAPGDVEPGDTAAPHSCGSLTCAGTEVCIIRCLCCGIDTGNPDDHQTDYECVAPAAECDASPSECVGESGNSDCYPSNDLLLECPCA